MVEMIEKKVEIDEGKSSTETKRQKSETIKEAEQVDSSGRKEPEVTDLKAEAENNAETKAKESRSDAELQNLKADPETRARVKAKLEGKKGKRDAASGPSKKSDQKPVAKEKRKEIVVNSFADLQKALDLSNSRD